MAFRDMMNNYFYGKQGKGDFTLANLPKNRRELFGEVLKVRWSQMVGLNLLYLIIWIPAVLWSIRILDIFYSLIGGEAVESGTGGLASLMLTWLVGLAPCIAITGPFNAGASYVLRNWARDQHSFLFSDFKDAVKDNWKQSLAISCISGLMPLVVYISVYFYSAQMRQSMIFILPIAIVLLVGLVWTMSTMIAYPMLVTYELKLKDVLRNCVLLTIGKLPHAMLIKLITLVVPLAALFVVWFVPGSLGYALMALSILYALFMLAFNKLVTVSYANWLCETYLNPRIEGAQTNIGLRPENWDDVEYRPEDDEE